MKPFVWVERYQKMGIWGCLSFFCQLNHCKSWGLMLTFLHDYDYVDSTGEIQNERLFDIVDEPIMKEDQKVHTYLIPVSLKQKLIFIWNFKTQIQISETEMKMIQFNLELLVLFESCNVSQYPTFLIFLYPAFGKMSLINQTLIHSNKRSVFFLNGQKGTGKKTFVQCFILFHFHSLIKKESLTDTMNRIQIALSNHEYQRVIYIPELALLNNKEQMQLLFEVENQGCQILIASIYDCDVLYSNQIISQDIRELCLSNQILMPSLSKRGEDVSKILKMLVSIKSFHSHSFQNIEPKKLDKIEKCIVKKKLNLGDIQQKIEQFIDDKIATTNLADIKNKPDHKRLVVESNLLDQPSLDEITRGQTTLRKIVAKIEISAIEYAHKQVGNSQNRISDFLGISRGSLQNKIKKYKIDYADWID